MTTFDAIKTVVIFFNIVAVCIAVYNLINFGFSLGTLIQGMVNLFCALWLVGLEEEE